MTEPTSTGIGGDMFCLFYDAAAGTVSALNGSGRSGAACTLDRIRSDLGLADGETGELPLTSVHAATVPGAAAGWVDTIERFGSGKLSLEEILAPAIELGEKGFPVSEDAGFFVCFLVSPPFYPYFVMLTAANIPSGHAAKRHSARPRPTLPRCSRPTRPPPTAYAPRGPGTS